MAEQQQGPEGQAGVRASGEEARAEGSVEEGGLPAAKRIKTEPGLEDGEEGPVGPVLPAAGGALAAPPAAPEESVEGEEGRAGASRAAPGRPPTKRALRAAARTLLREANAARRRGVKLVPGQAAEVAAAAAAASLAVAGGGQAAAGDAGAGGTEEWASTASLALSAGRLARKLFGTRTLLGPKGVQTAGSLARAAAGASGTPGTGTCSHAAGPEPEAGGGAAAEDVCAVDMDEDIMELEKEAIEEGQGQGEAAGTAGQDAAAGGSGPAAGAATARASATDGAPKKQRLRNIRYLRPLDPSSHTLEDLRPLAGRSSGGGGNTAAAVAGADAAPVPGPSADGAQKEVARRNGNGAGASRAAAAGRANSGEVSERALQQARAAISAVDVMVSGAAAAPKGPRMVGGFGPAGASTGGAGGLAPYNLDMRGVITLKKVWSIEQAGGKVQPPPPPPAPQQPEVGQGANGNGPPLPWANRGAGTAHSAGSTGGAASGGGQRGGGRHSGSSSSSSKKEAEAALAREVAERFPPRGIWKELYGAAGACIFSSRESRSRASSCRAGLLHPALGLMYAHALSSHPQLLGHVEECAKSTPPCAS